MNERTGLQPEFQLDPVLLWIVLGALVIGVAAWIVFRLSGRSLFGPPGLPPPPKKKRPKEPGPESES